MWEKIAILAVLAGVLGYWYRVERPKEQQKKREQQMMADYSEIITGLTVLTGAGLALPQAWIRLAEEYEAARSQRGIRWAYEEMVVTSRQIQNGISPGRAFAEYGRRIGLHVYIKLGNLLEQNMKKGTKGLSAMLQLEAYQAFEERKHQVRRQGESLSVRLLFPLFLMLGVVLIIILVPAIRSFSL